MNAASLSIWSELLMTMAGWLEFKTAAVKATGLTRDSLHLHFGLAAMLVPALITGRRPDSFGFWLLVFAAELFNEAADYLISAPGDFAGIRPEMMKDIANTMFWPSLLLLFGRRLFPRRRPDLERDRPSPYPLAPPPE